MKTTGLDRLRAYWDELRAGRVAPYRAELDPRAFDAVLSQMFILEQTAPGQVRVRLGGQAVCEMMGMEVRGMPPEALIDAQDRPTFQSTVQSVLSLPATAELDLTGLDADGAPIAGRMLMLPLRSDFGEISRVMGAIAVERMPVRAPANFAITAQRIVAVDGEEQPAQDLPGFAEPVAPFAGPTPLREVVANPAPHVSRPRRGHLRVIED